MAYRSAHGNGAKALARVETLPADELPEGIPAKSRPELPGDRDSKGRFLPRNSVAQKGGEAKGGKSNLASRLGHGKLPPGNEFAPYRRWAATFRRTQCTQLANNVGGGKCGPGPSSIVASAALMLAWSRYLSDKAALTGDADMAIKASNLAEKSRGALLTAHELCAREALSPGRANEDKEPFKIQIVHAKDGGKSSSGGMQE